jgi:transposase
METGRVLESWRIPEVVWERMKPLLPSYANLGREGGRPRVDTRSVMDGIFYVLRTGCQWKGVPRVYGTGSTVHRYFQEWVRAGVFRKLWEGGLLEYEELQGIQWDWQSIDGAITKAPLGGGKNRPQPHGSGEIRDEAIRAYGWRRRSAGIGGGGSQHS